MLLCLPHQVWTLTPSPEPFWETLGMGRIPPNSQKFTDFPHQKNSLLINLHPLLSKLLFLPHQIATFMYVIALHKLHLQLQSLLLYHFFFYLQPLCSHMSAYHGKSTEWLKFPQAKFALLPPFNAIQKTLLLLMLVLIFFPLPFLFQAL